LNVDPLTPVRGLLFATHPNMSRVPGYEGHFEHFEGGWTVGFESYSEDADLAPYFNGLPNDERRCEHLGSVIKGKLAFRSGGQEEVFEAGDAHYAGAGHTPVLYAGTEVVEFSPTEALGRTMEAECHRQRASPRTRDEA
jgi:hypothetical protein